ncbi:MATE family efflux transporter [Paenibacillus turpanensis]|uniref:MATE family efflux transporter n=1 Tax=Paenibacillus turpanensis TaxID=2689078 RepID=UPI00140AEF88|nr:MATE family efflux transporter [Paenibacillus turpanensis]
MSNRKKEFWGLVWPLWIEMVLMLLMGSSDLWMLSFVSDEAVAATAPANQYIMLALLVLRVVTVGTQVILAQYLGAKQEDNATRVAVSSVTFNLLIGAVLSIVLVVFAEPLLAILHTDALIMNDAMAYLQIVGGFLFVQACVNGLTGVLRVYGYAKETMWASIGMNALNAAGNGLLIFGWGILPELGVTGAAISTSASRIAAAGYLLVLLARLTPVRLTLRSMLTFNKQDMKNMINIGMPAALETTTYHVVQTIFLGWISTMGLEAVAARQYVLNIASFTLTFGAALSSANSIVVGKLAGAGDYDEAYRQTYRSVSWGFSVGFVVNMAAWLCAEPLLRFFTDDPAILEWGKQLLLFNLLLESGKILNFNAVSALRSVGDSRFTLWMAWATMVGVSLPVGYWLCVKLNWGLAGIWLATSLDEWLRAVAMFLRWKSRKWQRFVLVQGKTAAS